MGSVRYRSGAKLSGALYLSGKTADGVGKFSGADWESSVLHFQLTIPEGDLDFAFNITAANISPTSGTATNLPWVWTSDDNASYAVIWGDGTIERLNDSHTYPAAGVYDFYGIGGTNRGFDNADRLKVTSLKNIGAGVFAQYGGVLSRFNNCLWESPTMPIYINGPRFMQMPLADFDATHWLTAWNYNTAWMGHNGSGVMQSMTNFNNAGVGGVGVGIDTWQFPGQKEVIASGTVDSLTTNQLVDSTASFLTDIPQYPSTYVAIKNLTTGATAYSNFNHRTDTTITLYNVGNASRTQLAFVNKDIFTAVGQQYEIVNSWATNSNFGGAFSGWASFNHYVGSWNLKGLIDCFGGFSGWNSFNNGDAAGVAGGGVGQGMDNWDVSWCSSLDGVPTATPAFNQYINSWNVGNNQRFGAFFNGATTFNRPLNNWNIGQHLMSDQPIRMESMFRSADAFNQDIGDWDVSKVSTMSNMFYHADSFNNGGVGGSGVGLDTWDTSEVTLMTDMFNRANLFDQDIGTWDVGKVSGAHGMFESTLLFNSKPTSGNWGANLPAGSEVNLSGMFGSSSVFNQDIGYFDTSRVWSMASMISRGGGVFNNGGVGGVGVGMDTWDVGNVRSFNRFLEQNVSFNQYLGSWTFLTGDITAGTNTSVVANQLVDSSANFISSGVVTGMRVINNVTKKQAVATLPSLIYNGQRNNNPAPFKLIDTANVDYVAQGVVAGYIVNNIDAGTSATVVSVDGPKELTLTADIFPISNQRYSIQPTQHLNLNADIFTSSSTSYTVFQGIDMLAMFSGCSTYTQSMTNWNTENVYDMGSMFLSCGDLSSTDFSQWNVGRCTNFSSMFRPVYGTANNPDITNWDTSAATSFSNMFYSNQVFDKDISGWDTRNLQSMGSMFRNASYDGDFSNWNIQSLTSAGLAFSGMSTTNYDLLLDSTTGWASQATIQNNVSLSTMPQYTAGGNAEAGRNLLTGTYAWTIVDGGPI
jgi:surface protein